MQLQLGMLLLVAAAMVVVANAQGGDVRGTSTRQAAQAGEVLTTVANLPTTSATVALVADETAVYEATGNRLDRRDVDNLVSNFHRTGLSVTNLAVDASYLYVTAEIDTATNTYALLRLNKITLATLNRLDFDVDDNVPFSISLDASHIYVGFYTFPGRIVKVCGQSPWLHAV